MNDNSVIINEIREIYGNRPHIAYVRSFVEDAGIAIYDTIPKKTSDRASIRDKLKTTQKEQPTTTDRPKKVKGKDMEL